MTQLACELESKAEVDAFVNAQTASWELSPGYLGTESYLLSSPTQARRTVLRHFTSQAEALACLRGHEDAVVTGAWGNTLVTPPSTHLIEDTAGPLAGASVVITARRDPREGSWLDSWQKQVDLALAQSPGFLGRRTQPPIEGVSDEWVTIVAFDTDEHLSEWLGSPERASLLDEAAPHTQSLALNEAAGAFTGWFSTVPGHRASPTWKMNAIVLLVLFPLVSLLTLFLSPHTTWLGFSLSVFLNLLIGTTLLGFVLVPRASRLFSWWLEPDSAHHRLRTAQGVVLILAVYGVWIMGVSWLAGLVR